MENEKDILTLNDIIEKIYTINGKKARKNMNDLLFLLNKKEDKQEPGVPFPTGELPNNLLSSLRTGGIKGKSGSAFPKSEYEDIIDCILSDPIIWFQKYIDHLKGNDLNNGITPNFQLNMRHGLKELINTIINDESIDIREDFRLYLKNPKIAEGLEGKDAIHWMRFSWLILFSILQNEMIGELEEVWTLPDKYRFVRKFDECYTFRAFSSAPFTGRVIKAKIVNDGDTSVIDVMVDFTTNTDSEQIPEWASVVCWLPGRPINYEEFDGVLKYEIRSISGLSNINLELENSDNTGGHMYYPAKALSGEWETDSLNFKKGTIPAHILDSFGAICFVIHPEDFCDTSQKAHFQIKNIEILSK